MVDNDENYKECIEREFLEEIGYKVIIENYINKCSLYHRKKRYHQNFNMEGEKK